MHSITSKAPDRTIERAPLDDKPGKLAYHITDGANHIIWLFSEQAIKDSRNPETFISDVLNTQLDAFIDYKR